MVSFSIAIHILFEPHSAVFSAVDVRLSHIFQ